MAEAAVEMKKLSLMDMPDWTKLPEELLQVISENLNNCFDVVHARSVCSSWRSAIPFPCSLLSASYSLPTFKKPSLENEGLFTLKKIPLFLFRVLTLDAAASASVFFMGGIDRRDESEDQTELPPPIQCSVKVKIGKSEPTLVNMLECQILSLGYEYRMIGWKPKDCRGVAFLPLNKEGGGEFVVLLNCSRILFVLTSAEMRWKRLEKAPMESCWDLFVSTSAEMRWEQLMNVPDKSWWDLVTFRGKFYASFSREIVVVDPYSLDVSHTTLLVPSQPLERKNYLVPYGNDELFLVELCNPISGQFAFRVSRLDEEAGKWVEATDLGDCVLFISRRHLRNVCCSAKELPHGCGVSGDSIVFTNVGSKTYPFIYGVDAPFNRLRPSTQKPVKILSTSPVVALRVER
ncbi:unnamed protein product [Microthlaspi erraticum]|uniref:F-box domain-containing protein n=1 Tax=Microthlaspi erraticum TaxID=1685480 RepID=A0A6D2JVV1_9BRAS|nr:unnamed protein product [Microthlaspi erraticum]